MKVMYSLILFLSISLFSYGQKAELGQPVDFKVHTFYYGWYGSGVPVCGSSCAFGHILWR